MVRSELRADLLIAVRVHLPTSDQLVRTVPKRLISLNFWEGRRDSTVRTSGARGIEDLSCRGSRKVDYERGPLRRRHLVDLDPKCARSAAAATVPSPTDFGWGHAEEDFGKTECNAASPVTTVLRLWLPSLNGLKSSPTSE